MDVRSTPRVCKLGITQKFGEGDVLHLYMYIHNYSTKVLHCPKRTIIILFMRTVSVYDQCTSSIIQHTYTVTRLLQAGAPGVSH